MAKAGTLTVRIIGDDGQFRKTLGDTGGKVASFAKAATAAGAAAAVAFGVKAVSAAVELNETLSKTQQVFGKASDKVTGFADEMGKAFGLPKQDILDAASNIGLVAKASGLSQDAAAGMSVEMAKLAADASSFFNVPLPEALEKIRSGLVGEAEPLRAFGVLLSAAAVEEKAVALGIAEAGEELTEQQKVMARSAIITEQMSDASGDLERTQDSLANRFRALKGRAENFAAEVGMRLVPFVERAFDLFEQVSEVAGPKLAALFATLGPIIQQWAAVGQEAFTRVWAVVQQVWGFISGVFEQFRSRLGENEGKVSEWRQKLAAIWAQLQETFRKGWEAVSAIFEAAIKVLTAFWDRFGSHIVDFAVRTFGRLLSAVKNAMGVLQGIFDVIIGILTLDWSRAWDGIAAIVSNAWGLIQNLVSQGFDIVKTLFGAAVAGISQVWSGLWEGIKDAGAAAINWVIGKVNRFISFWNGIQLKVPSVKIPGIGDVGGFTLGLPDIPAIPKLAQGGIVRASAGGTLAMVGEGGRDEAVVPLDRGGMTVRLERDDLDYLARRIAASTLQAARAV